MLEAAGHATGHAHSTMRLRVLSYSECLAALVIGATQRGTVQSVFRAAANIVFPGNFVLALTALHTPRVPNGLQLSTPAATFPFAGLKVGMPVLFGAQRLHIEALALSLDLTFSERWSPHILSPKPLHPAIVEKNKTWLAHYLDADMAMLPAFASVPEMAQMLCGRGQGLTPSGDDILAGWMAANWLLHGAQPALLTACQQILAVAEQQTNLLSQCWLRYAAQGAVAEPVGRLLTSLTHDCDTDANAEERMQAALDVLTIGATSGRDMLQGILLGLAGLPAW